MCAKNVKVSNADVTLRISVESNLLYINYTFRTNMQSSMPELLLIKYDMIILYATVVSDTKYVTIIIGTLNDHITAFRRI